MVSGIYLNCSSIVKFASAAGSLWFYAPNKEAPPVWAFLFAVSGILHAWQCMWVSIYNYDLPFLQLPVGTSAGK